MSVRTLRPEAPPLVLVRSHVAIISGALGPHGTIVGDAQGKQLYVGEHVTCSDETGGVDSCDACIAAVLPYGNVLLDVNGITLPSGTHVPEWLCAAAHTAYLLGLMVHADEAWEWRDQSEYLKRYESYHAWRAQVYEQFRRHFHLDEIYDLGSMLNREAYRLGRTGRVGSAGDEWDFAVLHTGYLIHRYLEVRGGGMFDPDAIWTYLALQQDHPKRYNAINYHACETPRCPYPLPRLPAVAGDVTAYPLRLDQFVARAGWGEG